MSLSIDVVITAFGRYDLTRSCLAHLARQTAEHRVILVDNGSTDDTAASVGREFPAVQVVRLEANQAFAAATNRGVAEGDGDIVVLLNNDVDCRPTYLEQLAAPLADDPGAGSVTSVLLRPGERLIDSVGLSADVTLSAFPRHQGLPAERAADPRPVLMGPAGAGAAYRRLAWLELGGLDERIFAYMEDFDLAVRLRSAGWSAAIALDAVAVHLGSATHGHRSAFQRRNGGFGRGYLLRRYGLLRRRGAARAAITEAIVVAGDLAISRDAAALKGRVAGWRAGGGLEPRAVPPASAIDGTIGLREALARRRGVYDRRSA